MFSLLRTYEVGKQVHIFFHGGGGGSVAQFLCRKIKQNDYTINEKLNPATSSKLILYIMLIMFFQGQVCLDEGSMIEFS